jgi:hypothetical protein
MKNCFLDSTFLAILVRVLCTAVDLPELEAPYNKVIEEVKTDSKIVLLKSSPTLL